MAAPRARRGKKRRLSFMEFVDYLPEYEVPDFTERMEHARKSGARLLHQLQSFYAGGKISAQDFCVSCHWAFEAGCPGGDFEQYSQPPGLQSGRYQQFLDTKLGSTNLHTHIAVPRSQPRNALENTMMLQVSLAFESVAEEMRNNQELFRKCAETVWPPVFREHEDVLRCPEGERGKVIPLALYSDGVRYQSPTSSHCDSMTGMWLIN
eukprot:4695098-Pyramimonas_sp.AAC.1